MQSPIVRELFNPLNTEHVKACVEFFNTGKWTKHFVLEEPQFKNLPHQVLLKYFLAHAK